MVEVTLEVALIVYTTLAAAICWSSLNVRWISSRFNIFCKSGKKCFGFLLFNHGNLIIPHELMTFVKELKNN